MSSLYGEAPGATALGVRLSRYAGRPVSQPTVSHWLAGRHPMMPWAAAALAEAWADIEPELMTRIARARSDSRMLRAIVAEVDGKS